jgi:hypothetical protein
VVFLFYTKLILPFQELKRRCTTLVSMVKKEFGDFELPESSTGTRTRGTKKRVCNLTSIIKNTVEN